VLVESPLLPSRTLFAFHSFVQRKDVVDGCDGGCDSGCGGGGDADDDTLKRCEGA